VQAGADSYAKHCAVCHGREARGGQGPSLVRTAYAHGVDDASVARTIREGFPEGGMPAFGAALSEPQVAGVVAFLRKKRAEAPPSTRPTVPLAYQPLGVPKGVVKTELHDFRVETVAKVGEPYSFAFLPDGRILITEMAGNLRIVDKGKLQLEPVPDAPGGDGLGLRGGGGRSLLDVTIDPDYHSNGWIYLVTSHAIKNAQGKLDGVARINRGRIRDGRWVDNQILTEFSIDVTTGLRMAFDSKRFLYIGTSFPDPDYFAPAEVGKTPPQLLSSPWGKILRMTADGKVPPDNPFVNTPGAFPYIYAFGIRAPLGLAVDRNGELWESEDGPRGGDELNHIKAGRNYGWPVVTWGHRYDAIPVPGNPEQEGMEPPVGSWSPSPAVSAIAVYGGNAFPRWKDNIIMGSLMQMDLFRIVLDGDRAVAQETILHGLGRIRDVRVSPEGYIYLLIDGGQLVRLVPAQIAEGAESKASALPADIYPDSGNRLPLPKREDMNDADRKIFDDIMARQQGGLSDREKARPLARMHSPGVSQGLEEAHHYLKYETGLGDRLMTIAVLTTSRELTNQFEWTQWEEHARVPNDTRYVEPKVIDAIKYCRPVTDLDAKDAAIVTLGREMFGPRKVSSETFAEVLRLFGRKGAVDLTELMALYGATADELVMFDQQLHAGQTPMLPAGAKSCLQ
jgi:glucose/arabinose dehydrogenase